MTDYIAKRTIKRDGKYIAPGEPVNVSGKEAEDLLEAGVIGKDEDEKADKQVPVAENTAPRLPASGDTRSTPPDDVARDAKKK